MRAGTPILERGSRKTAFECSFQCFACKSFVKISRKGGRGGGGRHGLSGPTSNPRMTNHDRNVAANEEKTFMVNKFFAIVVPLFGFLNWAKLHWPEKHTLKGVTYPYSQIRQNPPRGTVPSQLEKCVLNDQTIIGELLVVTCC